MSALRDARAHLGRAQEFFDAAELTLDLDLYNAATSNAVTSGINSKRCHLPQAHRKNRQD